MLLLESKFKDVWPIIEPHVNVDQCQNAIKYWRAHTKPPYQNLTFGEAIDMIPLKDPDGGGFNVLYSWVLWLLDTLGDQFDVDVRMKFFEKIQDHPQCAFQAWRMNFLTKEEKDYLLPYWYTNLPSVAEEIDGPD